jgi:hypothetical protein
MREPWQELAETSRRMAEAFLRTGNSRWIDIAISEGWERSLRDLVRSAIQQQVARGGEMPTLAQLDRFPMADEDRTYFRGHGQKLLEIDRQALIAARAARNGKVTARITGETAASGE